MHRSHLQKKILQTIFFIVFLITPSHVFSSSFDYTIGRDYIKASTPITSLFYDAKPTVGMPFVITNQNSKIATFGLVGSIHYLPVLVENYSFHDNPLFKLITFFNEESQHNLNSAYVGGRYFLPYSGSTYDASGNSYYWASHSDACSVLLYGYSWLINIPAKIFNEIYSLFVLDKSKNYGYGTSEITSLLSHKVACFIDIICNICFLEVEITIAFINTVIGTVIAFVAHPVNSLCSFFGLIYFAVISTILAIWDVVADILLILYHLLFN